MLDLYKREINYLRLSVTKRCNLRCEYCMPEANNTELDYDNILSFDKIVEITKIAVRFGITKVRITGGEPLLRKGIVNLVQSLAHIKGIKDLSMSTNGILLKEFAFSLANAGLKRVNISLDTLNPSRFKRITGRNDLEKVLASIKTARAAQLTPIKLNCVVNNSSNEPDALDILRFATTEGLEVRFIRRMSLANGEYWPVEGGNGGHCHICNKLRLSYDGFIKPCLFSDLAFNTKKLGPEKAIFLAIQSKPKQGNKNLTSTFHAIGG